ncbi:MAG: DarT ssDNA thymidine ADP-ribosyltransferase family protein, partial [Blastocatellia bacterium]
MLHQAPSSNKRGASRTVRRTSRASYIWCDAEVVRRSPPGTTIDMNNIKERRRLNQLTLTSHPDLHVGDCVP